MAVTPCGSPPSMPMLLLKITKASASIIRPWPLAQINNSNHPVTMGHGSVYTVELLQIALCKHSPAPAAPVPAPEPRPLPTNWRPSLATAVPTSSGRARPFPVCPARWPARWFAGVPPSRPPVTTCWTARDATACPPCWPDRTPLAGRAHLVRPSPPLAGVSARCPARWFAGAPHLLDRPRRHRLPTTV